MAQTQHVLVGQSGGPTAAINSSLAGVVAAGRAAGVRVTGMRYGMQGFLAGKTIDLSARFAAENDLNLLRHTPSSWLGSCRFKLLCATPGDAQAEDFYANIFQKLEDAQVDAVLYIGGNDSMDTIAKLSTWGSHIGSPVRFIGIPKTIDNDLMGTDHTPGYGSAARFVATSMLELARDADVYDLKSVTFVEIMGRDAGWLAGTSCLAQPDLVLLPEAALDIDALVMRLHELLTKKNTVMVGVSEGVRTADGHLIAEKAVAPGTGVDEFGHLSTLGGTSRLLASLVKERLHCKTRAVELSTLQRCASHIASATDLAEAFELGRFGVEAALDGQTAKMCALTRTSDAPYATKTRLVSVQEVANQVRPVPRSWIRPDGMNVTDDFVRYVAPLADGLPSQLAALS